MAIISRAAKDFVFSTTENDWASDGVVSPTNEVRAGVDSSISVVLLAKHGKKSDVNSKDYVGRGYATAIKKEDAALRY